MWYSYARRTGPCFLNSSQAQAALILRSFWRISMLAIRPSRQRCLFSFFWAWTLSSLRIYCCCCCCTEVGAIGVRVYGGVALSIIFSMLARRCSRRGLTAISVCCCSCVCCFVKPCLFYIHNKNQLQIICFVRVILCFVRVSCSLIHSISKSLGESLEELLAMSSRPETKLWGGVSC